MGPTPKTSWEKQYSFVRSIDLFLIFYLEQYPKNEIKSILNTLTFMRVLKK